MIPAFAESAIVGMAICLYRVEIRRIGIGKMGTGNPLEGDIDDIEK